MRSEKKIKFLIFLSILLVVSLLTIVVFQIVNINKINNRLDSQNKQITQLEKDLDYYKNKQPESNFETIT